MPATSRREVSRAIAALMPNILRGVQLDFFVKQGVTQTQFLVLMAIHASSRCTMGALARTIHVSLPTASGIVERLVRAGYVRRRADAHDRRQVVVELTVKSHSFIQQFQIVVSRRWEEVLRLLDQRELQAFHRVITRLNEQFTLQR